MIQKTLYVSGQIAFGILVGALLVAIAGQISSLFIVISERSEEALVLQNKYPGVAANNN